MSMIEKFAKVISDRDSDTVESQLPVINDEQGSLCALLSPRGVTFVVTWIICFECSTVLLCCCFIAGTFTYVKHSDIFVVAISHRNINVMLVLSFLYRVIDILTEYFTELEEESIRDNFSIIYELFDEMCDFGYPQHTDPKVLKDFLCIKESFRLQSTMPTVAPPTNAVTWRQLGISYKKNEIFLDVIEKLNLLVGSNGQVIHSEINGFLKMKSCLGGMPELTLGLNDRLFFEQQHRNPNAVKTVDLEDIRFHQCVRLSRFETDRTISFIPPDGDFELSMI